MVLKSLDNLAATAALHGKKRMVVAVAQDDDVLKAVVSAMRKDLIIPILIGDKQKIENAGSKSDIRLSEIEIIHEPDDQLACLRAVQFVKEGYADILMKGLVSTGMLIKAVLDKENGLLSGGLLSHLAFFETPYYHKIFCITDAAVNIAPDINDKVFIINNAVSTFHKLGIICPKVAVLAPVEVVNPKMEATIHAAMLTLMQKRNQIKGCVIDGPLALDIAVSKQAAGHKGLLSDVAGDADILLTPDLNAGNMLYKSLNFLGGALSASIVAGASVPIVLTSRADSDKSKYLSIALAMNIV